MYKVRKGVTGAPELTCKDLLGVAVLDFKVGNEQDGFARKDLRLWKSDEAAREAGKVLKDAAYQNRGPSCATENVLFL